MSVSNPPTNTPVVTKSGSNDPLWVQWYVRVTAAINSAVSNVAAVWGQITGNLSDQKDLKAALDAKADATALSGLATTDFVTGVLTGIGADFVKPIQDQNQTFHFADDTGAANAYAVALAPVVSAYVAGLRVAVKIANANTTASTLAVNGLTATAIKKESSSGLVDLSAGDLQAGGIYVFTYDGTVFQLAAGGFSNPMTTLGDTLYEDATPAATRLPGNTTSTKKFLTQTGTGSVSAAPGWNTIAQADVPAFTGDSGSGGTLGGVPAPAAGDGAANKVLKADGTWGTTTSGTVTTTGSPASGELAKFSGASSITNGNLSGDVTTNNTLATEVVGILSKAIDGTSPDDGNVLQYQSSTGKWELVWIPRQFIGGIPGAPTGGQEVLLASVSFPCTFPANFSNSYGSIGPNGANPAATVTLTVKKTSSGVVSTVGTISISTSGVFTFATTGGAAQSLGSGDLLSVVNQSPADSTLASPSFVLVGYLGSTAPSNPITGGGNVSGPGSSTNNDIVLMDGATGNVIKDSGAQISTDETLGGASPSDTLLPTQKAVSKFVGKVLLAEYTANNSSTEVDVITRNAGGWTGNAFQSDFDEYIIEVVNLTPATNGAAVQFQVYAAGYQASSYRNIRQYFISGSSGVETNPGATTYIQFDGGIGNSTRGGISGFMRAFTPTSGTIWKNFDGSFIVADNPGLSNDMTHRLVMAQWQSTTAITGFRISTSSGNWSSGSVRLYGMAK